MSTPTADAQKLQGSTLTYFPLAGRGEATRLALYLAGVDFVDRRITFPEWKEFKPLTPWGGLPTLELADGTMLGQGRALLRLAGKAAGLYPQDAIAAAMVDNLLDALDDVAGTISKVPKDERAESAKSGAITNAFSYIEAFMAKHGRDGFAVGDSLTIADLAVFVAMGSAVGTIFDNMTPSMLEPYPTVIAVRKQVANHPKVVEWFGQQETKDFWKQEVMGATVEQMYQIMLAKNL